MNRGDAILLWHAHYRAVRFDRDRWSDSTTFAEGLVHRRVAYDALRSEGAFAERVQPYAIAALSLFNGVFCLSRCESLLPLQFTPRYNLAIGTILVVCHLLFSIFFLLTNKSS